MRVIEFREVIIRSMAAIFAADGEVSGVEMESASDTIASVTTDPEVAAWMRGRLLDMLQSGAQPPGGEWILEGASDVSLTPGQLRVLVRALERAVLADDKIDDSEVAICTTLFDALGVDSGSIRNTSPRLYGWLSDRRANTAGPGSIPEL